MEMMNDNIVETITWNSPCGELILGSIGGALCMCDWCRDSVIRRIVRHLGAKIKESRSQVTDIAVSQLKEYFAGVRRQFDLPILHVGTPMQRLVWQVIETVGYGNVLTYKELAARVGNPAAVRAVANATGANPMSIIVPCHRIIGSDGNLTGYAGGLEAKRILLDLECGYSLPDTLAFHSS